MTDRHPPPQGHRDGRDGTGVDARSTPPPSTAGPVTGHPGGRRPRPAPGGRTGGPLGAALAILVVDNVLTNRVAGDGWYVPVRLTTAVALVAVILWARCSPGEVGASRRALGPGLRWGLVAVAVVGITLGLAALAPATRPLFEDRRVDDLSTGVLAYQTLVRIPLGTVVVEELAFRGVLLGLFLRAWPRWAAVAASSLLFGLWHLLPGLNVTAHNPMVDDLSDGTVAEAGALSMAVAGTAVGGAALCWLRLRSRSLLAPCLAHVATNAGAYTLAWLVLRAGA